MPAFSDNVRIVRRHVIRVSILPVAAIEQVADRRAELRVGADTRPPGTYGTE